MNTLFELNQQLRVENDQLHAESKRVRQDAMNSWHAANVEIWRLGHEIDELRASLDAAQKRVEEARAACIEAVGCKERYHDKAIAWLSANPEQEGSKK